MYGYIRLKIYILLFSKLYSALFNLKHVYFAEICCFAAFKRHYSMSKRIIITGGAGFIGSHVVRLFVNKYPDYTIINLDALTYAGNLENLKDIEDKPNYYFEKVNILDVAGVKDVFEKYDVTDVIHLAAESHVDRSI